MMKRKILIVVLFVLSMVFLTMGVSCASVSGGTEGLTDSSAAVVDDSITSPEDLIKSITSETLALLEGGGEVTLAVYYFTQDGKVVPFNDYLVNSLTSQIAGMSGSINVVSRNALDRLMEEYSFQMSDLVDEDNRARIGRQIGADVVMTGFISSLREGVLDINIQFIEVETGVVKEGFSLRFTPDEDFLSGYSEKVTVQKEFAGLEGIAVKTVVLEDFEQGYSEYTAEHYEGHWGPGIGEKPRGKNGIKDGAAYYAYSGDIDFSDKRGVLHETDIEFYTAYEGIVLPEEIDGIYLKLKNSIPLRTNVMLRQGEGENEKLFTTHLLITDTWDEYYIDLKTFYRDRTYQDIPFDWSKPFSLLFYTSFNENFHLHYFNETEPIMATLFIDDLGYYKLKGQINDYIIEDFDSQVDKIHFVPEVYGTKYYVDYSTSDSGVLYFNEAVTDFSMELEVMDGGPKDNYLRFTGKPVLDFGSIDDISFPNELYFSFKAFLSRDFSTYSTLQFLVRSNMAEQGSIELYNTNTEYSEGIDFGVNDSWSKVSVEIDKLETAPGEESVFQLMLHFEVTKDMLVFNQQLGEYEIIIEVDDFLLR